MPQKDLLGKISQLRDLMKAKGIDGYLIPSTDEFNNEYIPEFSKRLAWCTGFTGSNGLAVITNSNCYLYTDGRYLLQAKAELPVGFILRDIAGFDLAMLDAKTIGYDPMLHSHRWVDQLKQQTDDGAPILLSLYENLIDLIWKDKPLPTGNSPYQYDNNKSQRIDLVKSSLSPKADFLLISAPDQFCWLAGIRGDDVEYTPLHLCYGLLSHDGQLEKFLDHKLLQKRLYALQDKTIQIDPSHAPAAIVESIPEEKRLFKASPIDEIRIIKTESEIASMAQAHVYDAIAICNFMHWLDNENASHTEYELAQKLLSFRKAMPSFHYPSFATICGFAANGAIIHYNPTKEGSKSVKGDGLLLLDSGGQYQGGTTDVTRVIPIGKIKPIWKQHYTVVLQCHINLASAQFPEGTRGAQLDGIARSVLWARNLDYPHGTGHGVGVFLSVHEGPLRISKVCSHPIVKGAILSNEPGVYFAGQYGIRLENLMATEAAPAPGFLSFKPLTMVPFDKRLIDLTMLDKAQLKWLLDYHKTIEENLAPHLSPAVQSWLRKFLDFSLPS